jgi:hypothetical protein
VTRRAVENDDRALLDVLLRAMSNEAANAGYDYFLVGLHERDPLLDAARGCRHIAYRSRLYVVYWEDGADTADSLDGRVPHLEPGTL